MYALEVQCNGVVLAVAGAQNALMFSADICLSIDDDAPNIDIRGMFDLGDDRNAHVNWLEQCPVNIGDCLSFRFIETELATPPRTEVASDSDEHIAAMTEYEAQLESDPPVARQLDVKRPNASVQLNISDGQELVASLESGREFLSFRVHWDRWTPERCRISLSSFSQQEALARTGSKEWFQGNLKIGEQCGLRIVA